MTSERAARYVAITPAVEVEAVRVDCDTMAHVEFETRS
jgi:hypothetical protein